MHSTALLHGEREQVRRLRETLRLAAHETLVLQRRYCALQSALDQRMIDASATVVVTEAARRSDVPPTAGDATAASEVAALRDRLRGVEAQLADARRAAQDGAGPDAEAMLGLEAALHRERVLSRGLREQVSALQAAEVEAAAVEQQLAAARARIVKLERAVQLEKDLNTLNEEAERTKGLPADVAVLQRENFRLQRRLEAATQADTAQQAEVEALAAQLRAARHQAAEAAGAHAEALAAAEEKLARARLAGGADGNGPISQAADDRIDSLREQLQALQQDLHDARDKHLEAAAQLAALGARQQPAPEPGDAAVKELMGLREANAALVATVIFTT